MDNDNNDEDRSVFHPWCRIRRFFRDTCTNTPASDNNSQVIATMEERGNVEIEPPSDPTVSDYVRHRSSISRKYICGSLYRVLPMWDTAVETLNLSNIDDKNRYLRMVNPSRPMLHIEDFNTLHENYLYRDRVFKYTYLLSVGRTTLCIFATSGDISPRNVYPLLRKHCLRTVYEWETFNLKLKIATCPSCIKVTGARYLAYLDVGDSKWHPKHFNGDVIVGYGTTAEIALECLMTLLRAHPDLQYVTIIDGSLQKFIDSDGKFSPITIRSHRLTGTVISDALIETTGDGYMRLISEYIYKRNRLCIVSSTMGTVEYAVFTDIYHVQRISPDTVYPPMSISEFVTQFPDYIILDISTDQKLPIIF